MLVPRLLYIKVLVVIVKAEVKVLTLEPAPSHVHQSNRQIQMQKEVMPNQAKQETTKEETIFKYSEYNERVGNLFKMTFI